MIVIKHEYKNCGLRCNMKALKEKAKMRQVSESFFHPPPHLSAFLSSKFQSNGKVFLPFVLLCVRQ